MSFVRISTITVSLGLLAALGVGCSSSGSGGDDSYPPDCNSCRAEGQTCTVSGNCPSGNICNLGADPLYVPESTEGTCVKVVCQTNGDCDGTKTCGLEKVCVNAVCQTNDNCGGGTVCLGGSCVAAPNAADVKSCDIATHGGAIRETQQVELVAIAKNANGVVLPGVKFDWTSDDTEAVSVSGTKATGGASPGAANLTAAVNGNASVTCTGLSFVNFPTLEAGSVRVVLVEDDTGAPVGDVSITVSTANDELADVSDMTTGAAEFMTTDAVQAVTVVKPGYQAVSILSPGTKDIFIPLPRIPDRAKAGGFRGSVDISATKKKDIQLGLAGPAVPQNLLDFDLTSLIGDMMETTINVPTLGLNNQKVNLPGGVMLGLGKQIFTGDELRCQGTQPGTDELGCYVATAPAGKSAAWVLAGQLAIKDVTPLATKITSAVGGSSGDLPIGDLLAGILPLLRGLNHGVLASVDVTLHDKVKTSAAPAGFDCTDATQDHYADYCRGDYAQFTPAKMAADTKLGVLSTVTMPSLPQLPSSTTCAGAAVILSGAIVPGRGIVPLGLAAGVDVLKSEAPDCKIAGVKEPFGPQSATLHDGEMPLSMAPPHGGIEGSDIALIALALDPKSLSGNAMQFNGLVQRMKSVPQTLTMASSYLPYPKGSLSRTDGTFTFSGGVGDATAVRFEIQNGQDTWLVYLPAASADGTVTLPDVAEARVILGDAGAGDAFIQVLKTDGTFKDLWEFGSGQTMDNLINHVTAFAVQGCATTGPCTQN